MFSSGIMPHVDGPLYYPIIATISLESSVLLDIYKPNCTLTQNEQISKEPQPEQENEAQDFKPEIQGSILLEARSLYIATDDVYHNHMHGIRESMTCDLTGDPKVWNMTNEFGTSLNRSTKRVSITIRHVPKVLKNKIFLSR